jgi:two-component system, cell cycle sensor histidine kinase and response regulator CckA
VNAVDSNAAVADAEKMFRRIIGEDVNLATKSQRAISLVKVDPGQIEQVIMNLVVNARDAMPQGGNLTIEVSDVELDSEYVKSHTEACCGHHVLLAISDTGCGMTREVQARIFEPFFTTKDPGRGAGLGLAVAHGIIKQSGGHIGVLSELGVGTTFHIYLPVVDGVPETASQSAVSKPVGGSETILLVEDDEPTRNITVLLLQHLGYRVLEAAGGEDAVRAAEASEENILLLITDVVMPAMSGQELANALRSRAPTLKVLFQSGYTDPTVVRHGMLQPDIEFLQKPFTLNSLAKKVREILDRAGSRSEMGGTQGSLQGRQ